MADGELMKMVDELEQEMVPQQFRDRGWKYKDLPSRLTPEAWTLFTRWIGEGEFHILCMSEGRDENGGAWKRGQFIISPAGFENLRDKDRGKKIREEMGLQP